MTRQRFNEHQVFETLWHQGVMIPCYRCKEPITPLLRDSENLAFDVQREHLHEIALGGPDIPENCRYSHTRCHAQITNGTKATTAGSSKQRIAKVKRLIRKRTKPKERKYKWVSRPLKGRSSWPKRKFS